MKLRLGFVSNSSSSSFLIVGGCFDENEIKETLIKNYKYIEEDFGGRGSILNAIEQEINNMKNGLKLIVDEEEGEIIIGLDPENCLDDNLTLGEIKDNVATIINSIGLHTTRENIGIIPGSEYI